MKGCTSHLLVDGHKYWLQNKNSGKPSTAKSASSIIKYLKYQLFRWIVGEYDIIKPFQQGFATVECCKEIVEVHCWM
jgi:hypothetical protein